MSNLPASIPASPAQRPTSQHEMVPLDCRDTRWFVRRDVKHLLLGPQGLKRDEWNQRGDLQVVKSGPHREVIRIEVQGRAYYVKHNKIGSIKPLLQNLIRPSKAAHEDRIAQRVRALGIPTFETVARGETRRQGLLQDSYLISPEIPDTEPLDRFLKETFRSLPASDQTRRRHELARTLGRFTAQLHRAGITHRDFHAGNILIRCRHDEPLRLWLIDLHGVHLGEPLSYRSARQNLALLHQFFATNSTRSDRLRFFRAYYEATETDSPFKAAAADVQAYCWRRAHRHWARKDRKWKSGTRHLRKLRAGDNQGRGLTELGAEFLNAACRDPDQLFESADAWYKRSAKRRVAAITLNALPGRRRAYLKRIELRNFSARISQRLGRSSVRRAWENGHALLRRSIATPCPLLFAESAAGATVRQYLLTEAIPDSLTLFAWHQQRPADGSSIERRRWMRRISDRLARQIRWLHECGFEHRDLKSKNILVSSKPDDVQTWLLDLEAVRRWRIVPDLRRIQNLSRLNASSLSVPEIRLSDRLRFLKTYLGSAYSGEWKRSWRKIEARTRRKIVKNRKNSRPLS